MNLRLLASVSFALLLAACGGGTDTENTDDASATRATRLAVTVPPPAFTAAWSMLPNPNYAPPNGPYVRAWTEMTWDDRRQEMVIFGGNGPTGYENDIWAYNSTTYNWTTIEPNTFCPGNSGFTKLNGTDDTAFKYDPVNNLYWAFGAASGYRCLTYVTVRTAAAGSTDRLLVDPSLPGASADAYVGWRVRSGNVDVGVTAYDPSAKSLVLDRPISGMAPGGSFQLYAHTGAGVWYFDPTNRTWVGQNTPPGDTGPTPSTGRARIAPGVAYSDAAKSFVLFGGLATGTIDKNVWVLDLQTKRWTELPAPSVAPPNMRELLNSFVYDKRNDVFILFGGKCSYDPVCPDDTSNPDTWAYKLSTNTWTKMSPANPPSARHQQVMAYDEEQGVVVLFGGATAAGVANDTWVYHYPSNSWQRLYPADPPPARFLAQITYDPVNRRSVIFGGQAPSGMRADIWALKLTPSNGMPTVALTAPAGGSVFAAPATLTMGAIASDSNGTVVKVEFFANATKIGEAGSAPYAFNWSGVAAGSYALTAVATDNEGNTSTSAPVAVQVVDNAAPSVSLIAPAPNARIVGSTVTLNATASDGDGTISKVEFFQGGTKIGERTASPYTLTWSGVSPGSYVLTAVATDNLGTKTSSEPAGVTVVANQNPTVSLTSPSAGTGYTEPAAIVVSASASDSDGSVSKVSFYANGGLIGEATTAPYAISWTGVAAGTYALTAVAFDDAGGSTTSAVVSVSVNPAGGSTGVNVALRANGGVVSASSAYSANYPVSAINDGNRRGNTWGSGGGWNDATVNGFPDWAQVTFNGTKVINRIDVFTLSDSYLTDPAPTQTTRFSLYGITAFVVQYFDGSNWVTVPNGTVAGNDRVWRSFSFPAVSTDRVRVTVNSALYQYSRIVELEAWSTNATPNSAPSVALTSPTSSTQVTLPATVPLAATASDTDGSVAKVEFYAGATKLGERTSPPYTLDWTPTAQGAYSITAIATDNAGASTVSNAVAVTVNAGNQAPTVAITSPASGATLTAPATLVLTASAADTDGSVARVEFYNGTTKLGQVTSAPFSLVWGPLPEGSYTVTAVAYDNVGASTTSSPVNVVVSPASSLPPTNVALQSNGSTATASSSYSSNFGPAGVINGDRRASNWGSNAGWNDATPNSYPDWLQVTFPGAKTISQINVVTLGDAFYSDVEPTTATTFVYYGLTAFEVQYFDGQAWLTVPGGVVTGNNKVIRTFSFPPLTTDRIRVLVNSSLSQYSRLVEVEAWTSAPR